MAGTRAMLGGATLPVLLGLTSLLLLVAAMIEYEPESQPASKTQVLRVTQALDITPKSLAAVGLSDSDAAALLARIEDAINDNEVLVCALLDQVQTRRAALAQAREGVRNQSSPVHELAAAQADFESAQSALVAELDRIRAEAKEPLHAQIWGQLEHLAAPSRAALPVHLRTLELTDQEATQLRDALAAQRIAIRHNQPLDQHAEALIESAEEHTDAVAIQNNLQNNLQDVQVAWNIFFTN